MPHGNEQCAIGRTMTGETTIGLFLELASIMGYAIGLHCLMIRE